jgi:hypothetical protein
MSKITFTAVKSRGERPQETECNRKPDNWLHTARHKDGKSSVLGSIKEQENQNCNAKSNGREPVRKCQK